MTHWFGLLCVETVLCAHASLRSVPLQPQEDTSAETRVPDTHVRTSLSFD